MPWITARGPDRRVSKDRALSLLASATVGVVALLVRLPHLNAAFWEDEVASARILREPSLSAVLGRVARTESTPPLWYVLGWLTHQTGVSLADVRLLSVVFGVLLGLVVVTVGRDLLPLPAAAAGGALVALGVEFVWQGHQLRAYELLALIAALLALALRRSLRAPGWPSDIRVGLLVSAGLLTHYFFVFTLLAALVWLWLEPQARAIRRRTTAAVAVGAAVCIPWLPYFAEQVRNNRYWWIGPFHAGSVVSTPFRLFTPLAASGLAAGVVPVAALALVVCGATVLARRSAFGRLCALLALAPLLFAAAAWASGMRIFAVRNLIEIGPFVAVAAVAALTLLPRRVDVLALGVAVAALSVSFALTQRIEPVPYNLVAQALVREGWQPRDPVAVFGNFLDVRAPLEWYLPRQPVLAVSRGTERPCGTVFVLGGRKNARLARDVQRAARVGGYLIGRLTLARPIEDSALSHATILTDPRDRSACVRVVHNRRLAPIA